VIYIADIFLLFLLFMEKIMKNRSPSSLTPLAFGILSGLGVLSTQAMGQTWGYTRTDISGQIKIDTKYLSTVRAADSVTVAIGSGCAFGTCGTDGGGCENEIDIDTSVTPDGASVNASELLRRCIGSPICFVSQGSFSASLGLESSTHSRIHVNYSRGDSRYKSDGCPGCSEIIGTGSMGGSWAAAWPLNAPGGIDSIDVVLKNQSSIWSTSGDCVPALTGGTGSPEPIHAGSFNRITATYYDEFDQAVGTETYQGVFFLDHYPDGSETDSQSYFGDLYDVANELTGSVWYPAFACEVGASCSWASTNKDFEFAFTPPAGAVYVGFDGETTTLVGDPLDVNEDEVVDYFDRVDLALSVGSTVNDAEYQAHADLDHDGDVDQDDIDIIDAHPCIGDVNGDGFVDGNDVTQFINWFNASNPNADLTGDGVFDFFDTADYLTIYATGC